MAADLGVLFHPSKTLTADGGAQLVTELEYCASQVHGLLQALRTEDPDADVWLGRIAACVAVLRDLPLADTADFKALLRDGHFVAGLHALQKNWTSVLPDLPSVSVAPRDFAGRLADLHASLCLAGIQLRTVAGRDALERLIPAFDRTLIHPRIEPTVYFDRADATTERLNMVIAF